MVVQQQHSSIVQLGQSREDPETLHSMGLHPQSAQRIVAETRLTDMLPRIE